MRYQLSWATTDPDRPPREGPSSLDRQRTISRVDREWKALLATFQGLSDASLQEAGVVGDWSVRDLMCHITTWEEEALKALPLMLEGQPLSRYSALYGGIDAFNAMEQKRKTAMPLEEVRRELAAAHERLVGFLSSIPAPGGATGDRFTRRLRQDAYGHYREHAAQIAEWRASRRH